VASWVAVSLTDPAAKPATRTDHRGLLSTALRWELTESVLGP
jgi:hypothetical protein